MQKEINLPFHPDKGQLCVMCYTAKPKEMYNDENMFL